MATQLASKTAVDLSTIYVLLYRTQWDNLWMCNVLRTNLVLCISPCPRASIPSAHSPFWSFHVFSQSCIETVHNLDLLTSTNSNAARRIVLSRTGIYWARYAYTVQSYIYVLEEIPLENVSKITNYLFIRPNAVNSNTCALIIYDLCMAELVRLAETQSIHYCTVSYHCSNKGNICWSKTYSTAFLKWWAVMQIYVLL